jgi:hypothetical protein
MSIVGVLLVIAVLVVALFCFIDQANDPRGNPYSLASLASALI